MSQQQGARTGPAAGANPLTRFSACLLSLMDADLARQAAGERRNACSSVAEKVRGELIAAGLEVEVGRRRRLVVEDDEALVRWLDVEGLEQSLELLVELCASHPWAEVEDHPRLDERARDGFLGRLGIDLPGDCDEDDFEYVDTYLKEGRGLAGWSTARWAVVIGTSVVAVAVTGGAAAFLVAGEALAAGGVAAATAAIVAASAPELVLALAGTVLGGAGGGFISTVLSSDMSVELVDGAVVKRFALIRAMRRYPQLAGAVTERMTELRDARAQLGRRRESGAGDKDLRKDLDKKFDSFDRAIKRLEGT